MTLSKPHRKQVAEAVDALFGYHLEPFVRDFVRRHPAADADAPAPPPRIAASLSERLLRQEIEAALNGEHPTVRLELGELRTYLDELQESGHQHVYLFELPEPRCRDLDGFDPDGFRAGSTAAWIAEAQDGPVPASVRFDPGGELVLGWVETRPYVQFMGFEVDPETGIQTAKKVPREERAVSYFHLDLTSGEAELKIQKLQTGAVDARHQELVKYRALVTEVTGCEELFQLPLAPAIRRAMAERVSGLNRVTVVLPDGGRWTGGRSDRCPVDPSEVRAAVSLKYTLPATSVRIELDGRLDEVQVPNPCTPEQLRSILCQIRDWYHDAVNEVPLPEPPRGEGGAVAVPVRGPEEASPAGPDERLLERMLRLLRQAITDQGRRAADDRYGTLEAVREYLAAHPSDGDAGDTAEAWTSKAACAQFLRHIERVASREQLLYESEIRLLHRDERLLFRLFLVAAIAALAFVLAGGALALALPDWVELGTLTAVVGLISGGGSVLIRRGIQRVDDRLDRLRARQDQSRKALDAIQGALAISDPAEQSEAMQRVATMLCERALAA